MDIYNFIIVLVVTSLLKSVEPQYDGWQTYIDAWRSEYPLYAVSMYPFGVEFHDTLANIDQLQNGLDANIPFSIPFYGVSYQSCYISIHGSLSFSKSIPAPPMYYSSQRMPNVLYPEAADIPMLAVFYADHNFRSGEDSEPSNLFYRILEVNSGLTGEGRVANGMLQDISLEVRDAVIGAENFEATSGLVVTWYMVNFDGSGCETSSSMDNCLRNTYQAALVTDGDRTYVVMNYYRLDWVGGPNQQCDPRTGKSSLDFPSCKPAQAGVNAGESQEFTSLPYSGTENILTINKNGGSVTPGRFFFEVSKDRILRGGCTNDTSQGSNWKLQFTPVWGSMFGGEEISISGPCFLNSDKIKCRFGSVETEGIRGDSIMKASCNVPAIPEIGNVQLSVSFDGGINYHFSNTFIIGYMGRIETKVWATTTNNDWLNPESIRLEWNPTDLTGEIGISTTYVEISLYGYSEQPDNSMVRYKVQTLVTDASNTGLYDIFPNLLTCNGLSSEARCTSIDIGVIAVSLIGSNQQTPRRLWTNMIPLGWFTKLEMEKRYGSLWISDRCKEWHSSTSSAPNWRTKLPPCPCTLSQARADFGRFLPDASCDMENGNSESCQRHAGALHCVRSVYVTSDGAGSHCCYNSFGSLMYSGDNINGSIPSMSHAWGKSPYKTPPFVPTVSHWNNDIRPYYLCCAYQIENEYDCYKYYMSQRLVTADCGGYESPGTAGVFGDPHFITFDGTQYTFNGYGEFWLMKSSVVSIDDWSGNAMIQARFEQPSNNTWSNVQATVMTSVAIGVSSGSRVELRLNHYLDTDERIKVFYNGRLLNFPHYDVRWQDFPDVVIINNNARDSRLRNNFTVTFRQGVGIQVVESAGILQLSTSISAYFKWSIGGLLGDWNDAVGDDLKPSTGGASISPGDMLSIHQTFGWSWAITTTESLFNYRAKLTHGYYSRPDFLPDMSTSVLLSSIERYRRAVSCGASTQCQYDLAVMKDEAVAENTLQMQSTLQELQQMTQKVLTCGWLPVEFSLKKEPLSYQAGSTVVLTGCRNGYTLEGTTSYSCIDNLDGTASWDPAVTSKCIDQSTVKETQTKIAVVAGVPALILLILFIIALIAFCCYCRKKKTEAKEKEKFEAGRNGDTTANDEFYTHFHDVKSRPTRPILRPTYQMPRLDASINADNQLNLYRGSPDNSLDSEQVDTNIKSGKQKSRAAKTKKVTMEKSPNTSIDTISTGSVDNGSNTPPRRIPYQYPTRTGQQPAGKRKPPYQYPRNTDTLNRS